MDNPLRSWDWFWGYGGGDHGSYESYSYSPFPGAGVQYVGEKARAKEVRFQISPWGMRRPLPSGSHWIKTLPLNPLGQYIIQGGRGLVWWKVKRGPGFSKKTKGSPIREYGECRGQIAMFYNQFSFVRTFKERVGSSCSEEGSPGLRMNLCLGGPLQGKSSFGGLF